MIVTNPLVSLAWAQSKTKTIRKYKFCLAYENSEEEDYVTEKIWQVSLSRSLSLSLSLSLSRSLARSLSLSPTLPLARARSLSLSRLACKTANSEDEDYVTEKMWQVPTNTGGVGSVGRTGGSPWCWARRPGRTYAPPHPTPCSANPHLPVEKGLVVCVF